MKKYLLIAVFYYTLGALSAQTNTEKIERKIAVVGTAEMEIVPDEIFMKITLQEFIKDKKKVAIEELEKSFVNYVENVIKIQKSEIKNENIEGVIVTLRRKNKEEIINKTYEVKFKNHQQVSQLYSVLDSLSISSAYISKYSHTKINEYNKQIKINAIKAAKDKATYLLIAVDCVIGKPITISENSELVNSNYSNTVNTTNIGKKAGLLSYLNSIDKSEDENEEIGVKMIKLTYAINATFEIL